MLSWYLILFLYIGIANCENPSLVDFDCKIRRLAVEYAYKLQPFRGKESFQQLVDTLNLKGGQPGGKTLCFNATIPDGLPDEFKPKFNTPIAQRNFFVDSKHGVDEGNDVGDFEKPFKTVHRALEIARQVRGDSAIGKNTILFRGGRHYFGETVHLYPKDSGITFQNFNGERVWLSGSHLVGNDEHGENLVWQSHKSKENVWTLDLSSENDSVNAVTGLRINGERAVRARYPNGCTSDKPLPSNYKCMGYAKGNRVVSPIDGFGSNLLTTWIHPQPPSLHQKDWYQYEPETPTRGGGPKYQKFQIGVGGTCANVFYPPAGYWCGSDCYGGAPKPPGCIIRYPKGILTKDLPNAPYKKPEKAIIQSWRPGHWSSWMFQASEKSNDTHIMFEKGGFQGGRGENQGEAFFVENVEEELDADNEFFFDEDSKKLLYYHSKSVPPKGKVEVTKLKTLFALHGTQEKPVSSIQFLGLGIRDTHYTYMDNHTMPAGGDWTISLRAAFEMRGVDGVTIDSCTFEELDGNAILIKGFARSVTIENNDLHLIGGNMIGLLGETEAPNLPKEWGFGWNGTAGNQPRGVVVRNNFAYRCGLFPKQSSFFFQSKSMETLIQNNIFFHGPRAGINLNDGFGGGTIIENNLIFSTVMETGDHGPFNSWDRQPYAHRYNKDGSFRMEKDKNDTIRHNFFFGNYYSQEVIDNDDGSCYFDTHHNVLVYAESGLKSDFFGHSNIHRSNLYTFLGGVPNNVGTAWDQTLGHEDKFINNKVIMKSSATYSRYNCNSNAPPITFNNQLFTPNGKTGDVCGETLEQRNKNGKDRGTTVAKWPPVDTIIDWARELLNLKREQQISQIALMLSID